MTCFNPVITVSNMNTEGVIEIGQNASMIFNSSQIDTKKESTSPLPVLHNLLALL